MQHNGKNMLRFQAKDAYAYARHLLDFMFQRQSRKLDGLIQESGKSNKSELDSKRTEKLWGE